MSGKRRLFVISHTHWDPEWYSTYQEYRIRLVKLMDKLLHILRTDPEYKHFMLDGQVSMVEDYLEIRPEKEEEIRELVQSGRLLLGPWFILPEEFMLSPESHIRNLQFGHQAGARLGGVMNVSYLCDMPGHISQLPQIMRGFGIDTVCAWRGVHGYPNTARSEFTWRSPDGSEVLMISMIRGYNNLYHLPPEPSRALEALTGLGENLARFATTRNVLIMDGDDHREAVPEIPSLIHFVNSQLEDAEIIHSTLPAFVEAVREERPRLAAHQGELRATGNAFIFTSGILATRMSLKLVNSEAETLLESWAEPFSSFAWLLGSEYPRALLHRSWKYQLSNNFHDVIYGGHIDGVTADAMGRYKASMEISAWLTQEALYHIAQNIGAGEDSIVVFNPCGFENTEVANVDFYTNPDAKGYLTILDAQGRPVPFQVNQTELVHKFTTERGLIERKTWRGPGTLRRRFSLSLLAESVPGLGYKRLTVARKSDLSDKSDWSDRSDLVSIGSRSCQNEYFRLEIQPNGTLNITEKATGATYKGLNYFEDSGDVGDHYFYSPPANDRVVTTLDGTADIKLVKQGPVEAVYSVAVNLRVPRTSSGKGRSARTVLCPITSYVSVRLGSPRIDITTEVDNRAENHRLRVAFASGIRSSHCCAGSAFDVVQRDISPAEQQGWAERPNGMGPQRLFVSISNGDRGFTIINRGIPQYEMSGDGTASLTLLRCVSHLGKYYLPEYGSRNPNGFPVLETPMAQEPGKHTFHYSIYPHKGDWQSSGSLLQALSFNAGMKTMQMGSQTGELPGKLGFLTVSPSQLLVSAVKQSEQGDGLVVRLYNSGPERVDGSISLFREFREVCKVNLAEDRVEDKVLSRDARSVQVVAGPHEIATLKFLF